MKCSEPRCDRDARMAVGTARPSREDLRVTAYADDRTAPKTATRYCKEHGIATTRELLIVVVDADG